MIERFFIGLSIGLLLGMWICKKDRAYSQLKDAPMSVSSESWKHGDDMAEDQ